MANQAYTSDQLLAFRNMPMLLGEKPDIPRELRRRRRGNRAGAVCRNKRRRYRPTLPSIVMGNEAYTSTPLPPWEDRINLDHLLPLYKPLVCRQPATSRTVTTWSDETDEALKDCFETTMWEELCNPHGEDIDSLTDCITDYINFCVENTVPTRTVWCFPNNKPWINPDMKTLLKEKRVFKSGDKEELKTVQRELRKKIREGKAYYRRKMEDQLQQNQVSGVWKGLKTITGHKEFSCQAEGADSPLPIPSSQHSIQYTLPLTEAQVRMELRKIKARKAMGPDGISSRLLKTFADQLCGILLYMFDLSLKLGKVPQLWKTSCVVPVPKTSRRKDFGDYRPVALTSHLMKTLERLVLTYLRPLVIPSIDPLQFAYQPGIGVEDAVIFLLNQATSHLEKAGSTVNTQTAI
ncbi:hypothetical protein C0J45_15282 [Silurus meridionalis]|nr:hypothetical protein C0J45_15282 [Silurus meridionalis]